MKHGNNEVSEGYKQNVGKENQKVGIGDSFRGGAELEHYNETTLSPHVVRPKH